VAKARTLQDPEFHSFPAQHFHNTKRSLASYVTASDQSQRGDDVLVDESKEAQIHDLGEALKEIEIQGNYFGNYSLTVVVYDHDLSKVESAAPTL